MTHSGLTIELQLAYAPISNYDLIVLREEDIIQEILRTSMLYVITQRNMLTFANIEFNDDEFRLEFEIKMQGTINSLHCQLPLKQELIEPNSDKIVEIHFGSYDKNWDTAKRPIENVNGIKLYNHEGKFLLWLSPDKFIHLFQHGLIKATVSGDIRPFTTFHVHYVGKATDQDIWARLTGHSTLQDILSVEHPFNYGTLPTHEIFLLLFRVSDMLSVKTFGDDVDDFVDSLMGKNVPTETDISLDAEKVLIKLLNPNYNKIKFTQYPKSKDGLYKFNFNRFMYHVAEDITLQYQDRELYFDKKQAESDLIGIKENKEVEVINLRK